MKLTDRKRARSWVLVISAVALVLLLSTPFFGAYSGGLVYHLTCGPVGRAVAVERLWTPEILVNSPYGGSANATYSAPGGGWQSSTSVSNGSAGGLFSLDNWTVFVTGSLTVLGPGVNQLCSQSYTAMDARGGSEVGIDLLPANSTSDAQEPTQISEWDFVSHATYGSIVFANGYTPNATNLLDSCNSTGTGLPDQPLRSSALQVKVPVTLGGQVVNVTASLPDSVSFTYSFGIPGTWHFTDLSSGNQARGGGLAFDFAPCSTFG